MNTLLRLLPGLGFLAAALAGLSLLTVGPSEECSISIYELPAMLMRLDCEEQRREELDARNEVQLERIYGKDCVIKELIDDHLTLLEAADRFTELETKLPYFHWDMFYLAHAGRTERERHCREVILYTEVALHSLADHAATVRARLDAELQAFLATQ